jgi:hypothetical protein
MERCCFAENLDSREKHESQGSPQQLLSRINQLSSDHFGYDETKKDRMILCARAQKSLRGGVSLL